MNPQLVLISTCILLFCFYFLYILSYAVVTHAQRKIVITRGRWPTGRAPWRKRDVIYCLYIRWNEKIYILTPMTIWIEVCILTYSVNKLVFYTVITLLLTAYVDTLGFTVNWPDQKYFIITESEDGSEYQNAKTVANEMNESFTIPSMTVKLLSDYCMEL